MAERDRLRELAEKLTGNLSQQLRYEAILRAELKPLLEKVQLAAEHHREYRERCSSGHTCPVCDLIDAAEVKGWAEELTGNQDIEHIQKFGAERADFPLATPPRTAMTSAPKLGWKETAKSQKRASDNWEAWGREWERIAHDLEQQLAEARAQGMREAAEMLKPVVQIAEFILGPYANQPGYMKIWSEEIKATCAAIERAAEAQKKPRS